MQKTTTTKTRRKQTRIVLTDSEEKTPWRAVSPQSPEMAPSLAGAEGTSPSPPRRPHGHWDPSLDPGQRKRVAIQLLATAHQPQVWLLADYLQTLADYLQTLAE